MTTDLKRQFECFEEKDFTEIAKSVYEFVSNGRIKREVLVNLSNPNLVVFDPVFVPSNHKEMEFEIADKIICINVCID